MEVMALRWLSFGLYAIIYIEICGANLPPVFTQDMNNFVLSEHTKVGTIVYKLEGYDPEGGEIVYGLIGSDNFSVNSTTGEVTLIKPLDREVCMKFYR